MFHLWSLLSRDGEARRARHRPEGRLRLEALEDRTLLTVNLVQNYTGMNLGDTTCNCEPPDPIAAAGPSHIVDLVNTAIAFYDKTTGSRLFRQELSAFFAPLGGVSSLSDPVVAYDELASKFVVGVLDFSSNQSRFDFAVSTNSDPRNGFTLRRYDMDDKVGGFDFADFPRIGWNAGSCKARALTSAFSKARWISAAASSRRSSAHSDRPSA